MQCQYPVTKSSEPELLAEDIPYNLNLPYGIGVAYIDLAGLSVSNLKVKIKDAGALPFIIRARMETAIRKLNLDKGKKYLCRSQHSLYESSKKSPRRSRLYLAQANSKNCKILL